MTTTQTQIDERTFTITFERDFASPREDVYDAWIDPERRYGRFRYAHCYPRVATRWMLSP